MMHLNILSKANVAEVKAKWEMDSPRGDGMFYEASRPYLEEAERFCAEDHASSADGIYGLHDPEAPDELSIPGITKLLYDKPKKELRSVWNAYQPQLEEDPAPVGYRIFLTQSYVGSTVDLALSLGARSVSIYAHNGIMREWLSAWINDGPIGRVTTERNDTLTLFGNWFRVGDVNKGSII